MGGGFAKVLNLAKIRGIHETSMRILSEIGVKVNHTEVLNLLGEGGAVINKETKIARIPEQLP